MKILRRDFDTGGQLIREHALTVEISSREDGETYLREQIPRCYATHGFDPANCGWWARHEGAQQISWFFIQS